MDKVLSPERFELDPSATGASKAWTHWKRTFKSALPRYKRNYSAY